MAKAYVSCLTKPDAVQNFGNLTMDQIRATSDYVKLAAASKKKGQSPPPPPETTGLDKQ